MNSESLISQILKLELRKLITNLKSQTMKTIFLILFTATCSLGFSNNTINENNGNDEKSEATTTTINIEQLYETWHVTDAYVIKNDVKKDAMKEVRSTKFVFKKDGTFKIIDGARKNSTDKGMWKLNKDNSIEVTLYESKINFTITKLNENKLKLVSIKGKKQKVITFSSEEL